MKYHTTWVIKRSRPKPKQGTKRILLITGQALSVTLRFAFMIHLIISLVNVKSPTYSNSFLDNNIYRTN